MIIDVPVIKANVLILDGTLRFDSALESYKIEAKTIWIRGGKLVAGTST